MTGLDTGWATEQLRRMVDLTVYVEHTEVDSDGEMLLRWGPRGRPDELVAAAHITELVLDRVLVDWRTLIPSDHSGDWTQHREAAVRALTQLERAAELREHLGDDAPTLSAGALHPWVWEGARSLWASSHHAEAVAAAARKVNAETQNKVGRRDVAETDLMLQAFSDDDPAPGRPRLRLPGDDGGKTARSRRRGIRAFAEGCYAALRNPAAHDVADELHEHRALEQLAAFSVLARWVDAATVTRP